MMTIAVYVNEVGADGVPGEGDDDNDSDDVRQRRW